MKPLTLLLIALPGLAGAAPPAVNLRVEWRWVAQPLTPAQQAAVRDGATVVGTEGAVSPRGGAVVTRSAPPVAPAVQQLRVLNGESARLQVAHREATDTLDWVVSTTPDASAAGRVLASPRRAEVLRVDEFSVKPLWPGGAQPVRLAFAVEQAASGRALASTLSLPMGEWRAVFRADSPAAELQLRLTPEP